MKQCTWSVSFERSKEDWLNKEKEGKSMIIKIKKNRREKDNVWKTQSDKISPKIKRKINIPSVVDVTILLLLLFMLLVSLLLFTEPSTTLLLLLSIIKRNQFSLTRGFNPESWKLIRLSRPRFPSFFWFKKIFQNLLRFKRKFSFWRFKRTKTNSGSINY